MFKEPDPLRVTMVKESFMLIAMKLAEHIAPEDIIHGALVAFQALAASYDDIPEEDVDDAIEDMIHRTPEEIKWYRNLLHSGVARTMPITFLKGEES